jgi:hypothetical protein
MIERKGLGKGRPEPFKALIGIKAPLREEKRGGANSSVIQIVASPKSSIAITHGAGCDLRGQLE